MCRAMMHVCVEAPHLIPDGVVRLESGHILANLYPPEPSKFQRHVALTLKQLLVDETVVEELCTEEGLQLDAAVPAMRLAMEADGPFHFAVDRRGGFVVNGSTQAKRRLLRALGWHVVAVPFFEWKLLRNAEEEHLYLAARVAAALKAGHSDRERGASTASTAAVDRYAAAEAADSHATAATDTAVTKAADANAPRTAETNSNVDTPVAKAASTVCIVASADFTAANDPSAGIQTWEGKVAGEVCMAPNNAEADARRDVGSQPGGVPPLATTVVAALVPPGRADRLRRLKEKRRHAQRVKAPSRQCYQP